MVKVLSLSLCLCLTVPSLSFLSVWLLNVLSLYLYPYLVEPSLSFLSILSIARSIFLALPFSLLISVMDSCIDPNDLCAHRTSLANDGPNPCVTALQTVTIKEAINTVSIRVKSQQMYV